MKNKWIKNNNLLSTKSSHTFIAMMRVCKRDCDGQENHNQTHHTGLTHGDFKRLLSGYFFSTSTLNSPDLMPGSRFSPIYTSIRTPPLLLWDCLYHWMTKFELGGVHCQNPVLFFSSRWSTRVARAWNGWKKTCFLNPYLNHKRCADEIFYRISFHLNTPWIEIDVTELINKYI